MPQNKPINIYSRAVGNEIKPGPDYYTSPDKKIQYFNWWPLAMQPDRYNWFGDFVVNNVDPNKSFNFFSTHGDPRFVKMAQLERKIFYVAEDVLNWPWYEGYEDYCLPYVDLGLGFNSLNEKNYIRFPYWLICFFEPKLDMKLIRERIDEINSARSTKKYECVLINRHDMMNTRTPIYDSLKDILDIKCAGKWNNNTDELKTVYNDDKMRYVHEFIFNICPENVNRYGYVTEKIFEAFSTGSIPIYYGSDNNPEKGLINKKAVLFWEMGKDNKELKKEIIKLKTNEKYYDKFIKQEKLFTKNTAEYVYSTFEKLAKALKEMK